MKLFLLVFALICLASAAPRTKKNDKRESNNYREEKTALQVRKAAPGVIALLEALVGVLEGALKMLNGDGTAQDFAHSISKLFGTLEQMISIKGFVSQVPIIGSTLGSICDGAAQVFKNVPMLGGLIDQIVTGGTSGSGSDDDA